MLSPEAFSELMGRVQAGDPDAAAELVRHYEQDIRLEVRVRMRVQDGRMRRLLDSMDVTQSVLASFFAGVAAGRLTPQHPQQLLGLLVTMTRNKLLNQARDQRRQRRDIRRVQSLDAASHDAAGRDETPSQVISSRELLGEFRKRLTDDERALADRRRAGEPWPAIAAELGGSPEARRKQLERAYARIAHELGLDEDLAMLPAGKGASPS